MFGDGIKNGIYKVAENNTLKTSKTCSSVSYATIFENMNITKKCFQNLTNQGNFVALQRDINLSTLMK